MIHNIKLLTKGKIPQHNKILATIPTQHNKRINTSDVLTKNRVGYDHMPMF